MTTPKRRFVFSPFITAGVMSIDEMKTLVETMEAEGAKNIKLGGEIIFVWDDGAHAKEAGEISKKVGYQRNDFRFGGVRPVKMCSAETFCGRFQQPVLPLAMEIDRLFKNTDIEMKITIGVAGCQRSCSEPATKDIGIIAHPEGYEIRVGGSGGMNPRVAGQLTIAPDRQSVLEIIGAIIKYCSINGKRSSRLGKLIEKKGMDSFKEEIEDLIQQG